MIINRGKRLTSDNFITLLIDFGPCDTRKKGQHMSNPFPDWMKSNSIDYSFATSVNPQEYEMYEGLRKHVIRAFSNCPLAGLLRTHFLVIGLKSEQEILTEILEDDSGLED